MKKQLFISFSGGLTSAYMTWWLLDNLDRDKWDIVVIFANTGKEREETLEFVRDCDLHFGFNTIWVEAVINPEHRKGTTAKVVTFETAARHGEPFEAMIQKYGIPNVAFPHCTRELKTQAMTWHVRNVIGWRNYHTAIGIRADEIDRMNPRWQELKYIYPFITAKRTTRYEVNKFWSEQPFTLRLKSYEGNCDFCFKKSKRKLMTLCQERIFGTKWWGDMEGLYGEFIPPSHNQDTALPIRFFRDNLSIYDLLEESGRPFERARDESENPRLLFPLDELDISNGCTESCEPF